jgi:hypothetical protein
MEKRIRDKNNSLTVDEIRVELDVGFAVLNIHLVKDNVGEISVAIALFRGQHKGKCSAIFVSVCQQTLIRLAFIDPKRQ